MLWLDFAGVLQDFAIITAGNTVILSSLNAAALALRPFTVVRTRGIVLIASDQSASDEFQMGALGFGIAQDAAVAAGVASLPTPITEPGSSNCFLWQGLLAMVNATADASAANISNVYEFDSKAQRKVENGSDIYVAAENESSTDDYRLSFVARVLIKTN